MSAPVFTRFSSVGGRLYGDIRIQHRQFSSHSLV
jgi:hypothetical protein